MSMLIEDCPRCNSAKVTIDVTQAHELARRYDWQRRYEAFCVCRGCDRATVFHLIQADICTQGILRDNKVTALSNLNNIFSVDGYLSLKDQAVEDAPDHLPEQINAVFHEGSVCMAVHCFNAAATMYRLCLDLATKALLPMDDIEGLNSKIRFSLGKRLEWLFKTGRLPSGLEELSSCVKEDGNDGAHEASLKSADAYDLQDFTVTLLERLYTEPKRLEMAKERRNGRRATTS